MEKGTVHNKESFLSTIADKLGRDRRTDVTLPEWKHQPQWKVYQEATSYELAAIFRKNSEEKDAFVVETDQSMLSETLQRVMKEYGGGQIGRASCRERERMSVDEGCEEDNTRY